MKKYIFKPYNPQFPKLFQKEKERILSLIPVSHQTILAIEHVGSTAVVGLGGKGIIDLAIAANQSDIPLITEQLQKLGYEFRPNFSTPDRAYLIIDLPDEEDGVRRYHVHLTYLESDDWKGLIGFRDYLRNHPDALLEYAEMKQRAAETAKEDGKTYRKLKQPMFEKFNTQAKKKDI